MGVDPRGTILALTDAVQVKENSFDVVFVLEKEGVFDCLS